jgi:hypothetical protein
MKFAAWLVSVGLLATGETITFDNSIVGGIPSGWSVANAHAGSAPWEIRRDPTARTQPYVFAHISGDSRTDGGPLAILDHSLRDGELSVRLKLIAGQTQAGGLVFRYRDENNYYLVREDARAKNIVFYKVVNGHPTAIPVRGAEGVRHDVPSNEWRILKVSARGNRFAVYLNHRRVFEVNDATFPATGKVGLWTRADSVAYFDDFRIIPR